MKSFVKPSMFKNLITPILSSITLLAATAATAQTSYNAELDGFDYPYPVKRFEFTSQKQQLKMAYLDVSGDTQNGKTIVLMHGKNFCAVTWENTITPLVKAGYRVIAPDQIGFCKSSKPQAYQFSFHQLANNTKQLIDSLDIKQVSVMGHSMGGMLATRYALMFPEQTRQLVLVNPIGLEDWHKKGVPYQTVDKNYQAELNKSAKGIRNYQQHTYYVGKWEPRFDRWVNMLAGMYAGEDKALVAWNQAKTSDMVFTQPVVDEFENIKVPTLLLIGEKDNTAIGKARADEKLQKQLGNYQVLGEQAASAIPNATLIEFADLGHSPHIQEPERFHRALFKHLR